MKKFFFYLIQVTTQRQTQHTHLALRKKTKLKAIESAGFNIKLLED